MTKRRRSLIAFLLCLIAVLFFIVVFGNLPFLKRGKPRFSVAVVGFMGTDSRTFKEAGDKLAISVETFSRFSDFTAEKTRGKEFDAILLRTRSLQQSDRTPELISQLGLSEFVIPYPITTDKFQEFAKLPPGLDPNAMQDYLPVLTPHNAEAFLALLDREINGSQVVVPEPEELPTFGYFCRGPEVSQTYDEWLQRDDIPQLPEDAPCVAFIGPFLNPFKGADSAYLETLVDAFASRGIRAVPIMGFRSNLESVKAVNPDLIVVFPLGKILSAETPPGFFESLDVPVLTAINLSVSKKEWLSEPVGMTPTYQNLAVSLPELDGAIEPIAVSTIDLDEDGHGVRQPLLNQIELLASRAERWIKLKHKANSEKRVAIFYSRSPGAAAITAQSLDAVPSLYNALIELRNAGYDLGTDFPEDVSEFADIINRQGRTIGQWAPGAFYKFLEECRPEYVSTRDYINWSTNALSKNLLAETKRVWGAAPGVYFSGQDENGETFLAVSRIQFGNIVVLPQPTTAIIADKPEASDFESVHGTNKAPPHFYQAAYFWVREGFKADVVVNFGTHGSLEFTRGKSLVLSENCWPTALTGDLPTIYVYSINNVGEALLAKRRILSTIVSHTTPPFIDAPLSDENVKLLGLLNRFDPTEPEEVQREIANKIENMAREIGLTLYDPADSSLRFNDAMRVEFYREQLQRLFETSVTDGLHVIGRPWTEEQIQTTASKLDVPDAVERIRESTEGIEIQRLLGALSSRFIPPSSGGDALVNPDSLPTGRNIGGVNIEQTPDMTTFELARQLTDETLAEYEQRNGRLPRRMAFTFWGGEYLRTRGLTFAQALYALGARPVFDSRGLLKDIEVIPSQELGRARIDVVAQTSGQFRDAAPSRIVLLDRAVRAVASLEDEPFPNYVREYSNMTIDALRKEGFIESEATELSTARIFGAPNALSYGTGIRSLVERSDQWETRADIAEQYLLNMGGIYRSSRVWGTPIKGLFEANLKDVDIILQSRSSNTWGPVKLDHAYEFGTLAAVVREKNGVDPSFLLVDARRAKGARMQTLDEAIRDEMQTTFWNKRWLEGLLREKGGGGAAALAKATQDLFGWSAVGADNLIDETIWNRTYETLVDDSLNLGLREYFEETNPAALAETTAVMLDAVRKEYWAPSPEVLENLASVHAEITSKYGASCSYNVCGNESLRDFIVNNLSDPQDYQASIENAIADPSAEANIHGLELVEKIDSDNQKDSADNSASISDPFIDESSSSALQTTTLVVLLLLFALGFASERRRQPLH